MPHTRKIDDLHDVTIRSDRRRTGGWESRGDIFVSATGNDVGVTVHGEGRTMTSAEARARKGRGRPSPAAEPRVSADPFCGAPPRNAPCWRRGAPFHANFRNAR